MSSCYAYLHQSPCDHSAVRRDRVEVEVSIHVILLPAHLKEGRRREGGEEGKKKGREEGRDIYRVTPMADQDALPTCHTGSVCFPLLVVDL